MDMHVNFVRCTLMNCTILLEEERSKMEGERKHKFNLQQAHQQERTQCVKTNNTASKVPVYHAVQIIRNQLTADQIILQELQQ